MPRKARIDAPGALHHIILRGIERRAIVRDDLDRERFLEGLGKLLLESKTSCYAWAILRNHVHLLLRTGTVPVASLMARLLTGYAVSFNKRHRRHGHLFQNRYKSILCEEEPYLLELVRYINLNPVRAGIAAGMDELDVYVYSGHSALMGALPRPWQDTEYVLALFSHRQKTARSLYRSFIEKGISQGRRKELTGGGVVRSNQGWKASPREASRPKGDERILGQSSFVLAVLKSANEAFERRYAVQLDGFDFDKALERVLHLFSLSKEAVLSPDRRRLPSVARSVLCYWAFRELGITATALAKKLSLSQPAVSKAIVRGEQIAKDRGLTLWDKERKL